EVRLRQRDGRRRERVRGECSGGRAHAVSDEEPEVRTAALLEAGGEPRRTEPSGVRDAHGYTPIVGSPAVSSRPYIRFMFWMACPAAPFTRLSTAAARTAVPVRASRPTPTSHTFAPVTRFASGISPGESTRTNGAPS